VSVSIKKITGVESVNVSLKQGLTSIRLKPGNTVTLEQVRKAIQADGFAPKDARVEAIGELVDQERVLQFRVAGTNETFPVAPTDHAPLQKEVGRNLTVNGLISSPAKRGDSGTLQITSASGESPGKGQ